VTGFVSFYCPEELNRRLMTTSHLVEEFVVNGGSLNPTVYAVGEYLGGFWRLNNLPTDSSMSQKLKYYEADFWAMIRPFLAF
jgi:hypothetical protein